MERCLLKIYQMLNHRPPYIPTPTGSRFLAGLPSLMSLLGSSGTNRPRTLKELGAALASRAGGPSASADSSRESSPQLNGTTSNENKNSEEERQSLLISPRGKVLWVDCETTGVDPRRNGLLAVGLVVEINGEEVERGEIYSQPSPRDVIEDEALEVNGITRAQIAAYPPARNAREAFERILSKYVNKKDRFDKFVVAGWRVSFDFDFIRNWFDKTKIDSDGPYAPGCYLWNSYIDVTTYAAEAVRRGLHLQNQKLVTFAGHFGYRFEAHNALADVRATRWLYYKLQHLLATGAL